MKHLFYALVVLAVSTSPVRTATVFEDHFSTDSIADFAPFCDPSGAYANWSIADGVLHGENSLWCSCHLAIGSPSWEISAIHVRMNGRAGYDKGILAINSQSSRGISVNLRSAPWNDIYFNYNRNDSGEPFPLPHNNGDWMDVDILLVGADVSVYVNGQHIATRQILNPETVLPLNQVHPFVYTGGGVPLISIDYDDLVVEGNGVVAIDEISWGGLKASYR